MEYPIHKVRAIREGSGKFCDVEFCEAPAAWVIRVSVNRHADETRNYCAACESAFAAGMQHVMLAIKEAATDGRGRRGRRGRTRAT
jgi:hypothetical protein